MDIVIKDLGAIADGRTNNREIIQRAIDLCAESGGRVIISDGTYMTGTLRLKSNVELYLDSSGVLLGSPDVSDYPESENLSHVDAAMLPRMSSACLIFAECAENVSICGNGTVDCNGYNFVEKRDDNMAHTHCWKYQRKDGFTPPRAVFFTGCKNVRVEDVTMVNQPAGWSYWMHDCDFVSFDRVKILAPLDYPNNDGIHINCSRDVSITDSLVSTSDDSIVVRANSASLKENKSCERVRVSNCNLRSNTNAIRIGWVNDGVIRDCDFKNLTVTDSINGIAIHLPHRIRKNRLIKIADPKNPISTDVGREETLIENISFENITMEVRDYPIMIAIDRNAHTRCKGITDIRFSSVNAVSYCYPCFFGRETNPLGDICFQDCMFKLKGDASDKKSNGCERVYADKVRFINTEIK